MNTRARTTQERTKTRTDRERRRREEPSQESKGDEVNRIEGYLLSSCIWSYKGLQLSNSLLMAMNERRERDSLLKENRLQLKNVYIYLVGEEELVFLTEILFLPFLMPFLMLFLMPLFLPAGGVSEAVMLPIFSLLMTAFNILMRQTLMLSH